MDVNLHHAGIDLEARGHLVLRGARGARLACASGDLWITQDGDVDDHFIGAGETFEIAVDGSVIVQARRASRLMLVPPAPASRVGRLAAWFGVARLDGAAPLLTRLHGA
jgi:uncharacterized protein YaiE (UPF0345 family)